MGLRTNTTVKGTDKCHVFPIITQRSFGFYGLALRYFESVNHRLLWEERTGNTAVTYMFSN